MAHPALLKCGLCCTFITQSKKALINKSALILAYSYLVVKVYIAILRYTRTMQILQSDFCGKSIMSVHTGEQLCVVTGFVIHPDNLKIVLFITHASLKKQPYYLLPSSIRFADSKRLIIDSAQSLSEFDELVRYQRDILNNYNPVKKRVVTQSGKKLGTVANFSFDNQHNFVQKLYVQAGFFKRFLQTQFVIDRSVIIETTKNTIVVKDTVEELPATIKSPLTNKGPAKSLARPIKKSPN